MVIKDEYDNEKEQIEELNKRLDRIEEQMDKFAKNVQLTLHELSNLHEKRKK